MNCPLQFQALGPPSRKSELKGLGEKQGCESPSDALQVTAFSPFSCYPQVLPFRLFVGFDRTAKGRTKDVAAVFELR